MRFPDQFLCALGAWQNGWGEDAGRRLRITENLIAAISETPLPRVTLAVNAICYRKRFLVPWNPQNGADFFPLFQRGFISEGIASWTTDLLVAKSLKGVIRGGAQAAIFAAKPTPNEVILNIAALNALPEFRAAVADYRERSMPHAEALKNFADKQSEVILSCQLRFDELVALSGKSSSIDVIAGMQGITSEDEIDRLARLVADNEVPVEYPLWLEADQSRAIMLKARTAWREKLASLPEPD